MRRQNGWTNRVIESVKAIIREELKPVTPESREAYLRQRIGELEDDSSSPGLLHRFVYIIHALILHERGLSLSDKEVRRLFELGFTILKVQGIDPENSELAFLYGDLYQLRGMISRKAGSHWLAAWDQELATRFLDANKLTEPANAQASARRHLRKGNLRLALGTLQAAASPDLDHTLAAKQRLLQMHCLRLSGQKSAALTLADVAESSEALPPALHRDYQWERMCAAIQETGDLTAMLAAIKRSGTHYQSAYILECSLWVMAHPDQALLKRLPNLRAISRREGLSPKNHLQLYEVCVGLQQCYDYEIPYLMRMNRLGSLLNLAPAVIALESELLIWLAATRILARSRNFGLAAMTLSEYMALSLRVSEGQERDLLKLGQSLFDAPWFDPRNTCMLKSTA